MKHIYRVVTLLLSLATVFSPGPAVGAGNPKEAPAEAPKDKVVKGKSVEVKLHESLQMDGLKVRFDAVTEDSRCPSDVTCIWEGQATIRLEIEQAGQKESVLLSTSLSPSITPLVKVMGHEIALVQLRPTSFTSKEKVTHYEAVLSVTPSGK
jgi:hypothetical protein